MSIKKSDKESERGANEENIFLSLKKKYIKIK